MISIKLKFKLQSAYTDHMFATYFHYAPHTKVHREQRALWFASITETCNKLCMFKMKYKSLLRL